MSPPLHAPLRVTRSVLQVIHPSGISAAILNGLHAYAEAEKPRIGESDEIIVSGDVI